MHTNISKLTNNYTICPWCQGTLIRQKEDTHSVCQNCEAEYWSYSVYLEGVILKKTVAIEFLKDMVLKDKLTENQEFIRVWINFGKCIELDNNTFDDPKTFKNKLNTILSFI